MFGYIRPLAEELKVKEFYRFKACYCGLCHSLKREYGFFARFILNYDFVFLAMLLWDTEQKVEYDFKRCVVSPCRKKCVCKGSAAFDECAAKSVILAFWKLKDDKKDEKFFKAAGAAVGRMALSGAYKKARKKYPDFDDAVAKYLSELDGIERQGSISLDEPADKFASLLATLADNVEDSAKKRILSQIFYHSGRFIYIIDAVDDLEKDSAAGRYNPVASHFSVSDGKLVPEQQEKLKITLTDSFALIASAFELLPETKWSPALRNIVYFGMPDVCEKVFSGTFRNTRMPRFDDKKLTIQE